MTPFLLFRPEYKGIILEEMGFNKLWRPQIGKWSDWEDSGECFNDCSKQLQKRKCLSDDGCIGHTTMEIACAGEAKVKCLPKVKVCPKGWTMEFGTCYKLVPVPDEERNDILFPQNEDLSKSDDSAEEYEDDDFEEEEKTLNQISKLDSICCKDAFATGDVTSETCDRLNEYQPQLVRVDFKSEEVNIVERSLNSNRFANTQLLYLDLMVSTGEEDEEIKCRTNNVASGTSSDVCKRATSYAICEINLTEENNFLYKLLPRRCKTEEAYVEWKGEDCLAETKYAENRRLSGI